MVSVPEQSEFAQVEAPSFEKSEDASMDHVKDSLVNHLASIGEARTWSSYGPILINSPTPGLFLKDDGVVGLPLSPHDAVRIKRHTSQGSGSNKSDRQACKLSLSQFELRNPAWRTFVQSVGLSATEPFDIGPVHLNLRCLVLCDKSSGSAAQDRPNKDSDVIGSMAIVLSSQHEGGDFNLRFGNETRRFPTAPTSDFNESFITWYSDVEVDAEPIVSGYRLQLIYDVYQSQTTEGSALEKPSASRVFQQINEFRDLLGHWITLSQSHEALIPLVYILEDELGDYKHLPLSCTSLKGADKHKMVFLQRHCPEKGVHVYLAKLTTSIDDDFAGDEEESNTNMELHEIVEVDGHHVVTQQVRLAKENLLQEDWFEARDPNDSEYDTPEPSDPWEEVESCSDQNMRHFKDWAFVLLPASQRLDFLAKNTSPEDLHTWIIRLSKVLESSGEDFPQNSSGTGDDMLPKPHEELKSELDAVCNRAIDKMQSWRRYNIGLTSYLYHHENPDFPEALEAVVRATMILGNANLVREAMIECPRKLSPALWREVGRYLNRYTLEQYKHGLNLALRQIPTMHGKNLVLESIASGYRDASYEASKEDSLLDHWVQDRLEGALNTLEDVEEQDGRALVSIGKKHGRDFLLNHIIPFAKRHASNLPFAAALVIGVCKEDATEAFDSDVVCLTLREVFSVMIPAFTIENDGFSTKRRKIARTCTNSVGDEDMDRWSLDGGRIAHLIGCCLASDLKDEENYLLNKIASEASCADERAINVILMSFLQTLRQVMEHHSVPFTTQDYQHLFQYIIEVFIIEYVKMEPPRPANQTCPKAGCGAGRQCRDCWNLDDFLRHPSQQCLDLTATGQRRDHVERRVHASQSPYLRCDTIKNPHAPHTLRVTKTLREAWEANHSAWLRRCVWAKEQLGAIGHDALKQLLGDKYDDCVELRAVRRRQTVDDVPERPLRRTKERQTLIIDLDGDSV